MSHGRRRSKFWISGSSVADCVHTAIFQNIRENRVPYHAMRTKSREKSTRTDLRSTKEMDK